MEKMSLDRVKSILRRVADNPTLRDSFDSAVARMEAINEAGYVPGRGIFAGNFVPGNKRENSYPIYGYDGTVQTVYPNTDSLRREQPHLFKGELKGGRSFAFDPELIKKDFQNAMAVPAGVLTGLYVGKNPLSGAIGGATGAAMSVGKSVKRDRGGR